MPIASHENGSTTPPAATVPQPAGGIYKSEPCDICGKVLTATTAKKAKARYYSHRHSVHPETRKVSQSPKTGTTVQICYCPKCGLDLIAVATGIAMSSR